MKKGHVLWWVGFAGLVAGLAYWWQTRDAQPVENPYQTALIERRDLKARVTASGTLQALVTVQVGSQVSGRLMQLFADFNSKVTKGQVIARLDPQLFEASVAKSQANFSASKAGIAKAEATLLDAERTYQRVQAQRLEGLTSQQEVDAAQTGVAVAKAGLDAARATQDQARAQLNQDNVNLALTVIKSPIDGVVISRAVDVGQTVAASLQAPVLFTIAEDLTKMRLEASIPESDVGKLAEGMEAQFTVDAFSGRRFRGVVSQVRNAAVTVQNVVTYTAVIAVDNAQRELRPGMTATVSVLTASREGVLAIPNTALRYRPPSAAPGPSGGGRGAGRGAPGERSGPPGAAGGLATANGAATVNGTVTVNGTATVNAAAASATSTAAAAVAATPVENVEQKVVWRLNGNEPVPLRVAVGITDGSYTELLDPSLREGDALIVEGPVSAPGGAPAGKPGAGGGGNLRIRGVF